MNLIRSERQILANVSFSAKSGEAILLRGDNGVGKTSLLMAIAGYLHISSGEIAWSLEQQASEEEQYLSNNLHFIGHQNAIKPSLTLMDNVIFWCNLYAGAHDRVSQALEMVGLSHAISHEAGLLSAGQSKRLSLSRLLLADRAVWLLDEPTATLDKKGDSLVAKLIDDHLDRGGIAIIATHLDLSLKNKNRSKTLVLTKPQINRFENGEEI